MAEQTHIVTRGIVLRTTDTREADRILTVLSPDLGKIPVIAKGVRRKKNRFAATAQLLCYSEMTLYHRKDWYYLREGSTIAQFAGLRRDLERMSLAAYFAELTEAVTGAEPAGDIVPHLLNALYALDTLHKPPLVVKAAFELKLMALSGYEPLADCCTVCSKSEPINPVLDVVQGVLCCQACSQGNGKPLDAASVAALRHILYDSPKRLYAFSLSEEGLKKLSEAAEAFVSAQLDRGFKTLDFYHSLF